MIYAPVSSRLVHGGSDARNVADNPSARDVRKRRIRADTERDGLCGVCAKRETGTVERSRAGEFERPLGQHGVAGAVLREDERARASLFKRADGGHIDRGRFSGGDECRRDDEGVCNIVGHNGHVRVERDPH